MSMHLRSLESISRDKSKEGGEVLLRDFVHDRLVDMIISGALEPGSSLREERIAAELGTSRVPVREAIQRLAEVGWVSRQSRAGARVRVPDRKLVDDVFGLRALLEGEAAKLAANNTTQNQIEALRNLVNQARAAEGEGDIAVIVAINDRFHESIAKAAGNELMSDALSVVASKSKWL